jgi:hypothetical protein
MPVTTAKLALRTPVTADNNDTPTFMLNLANDIVSSLDFGTFAARPAASAANQGRRYYATDRDREYFNTSVGRYSDSVQVRRGLPDAGHAGSCAHRR